jgi:hypothetical protein
LIATLDIPDDLYRRVKARSALEGRPIRSVAVELFNNWLAASPAPAVQPPPCGLTQADRDAAPWLAITQPYVKPGLSHAMDDIRVALAKGWSVEIVEKIPRPETKP